MDESSARGITYHSGRNGETQPVLPAQPVPPAQSAPPPRTARPARPRADARLARLITELQGHGLRVEVPLESRQGGAGPADAGMLWIDGVAATVPTGAQYAQASPYVLRAEDDG